MQYDMNELMRLAQSPAGQQLIAHLQRSGGKELQAALASVSAGNYDAAKQALSSLLSSPDVQALVKQLEVEP